MRIGVLAHSFSAVRAAVDAAPVIDAFEIRFDLFKEPFEEVIQAVRQWTDKPLLFTLRSKAHGGAFTGDPYSLLELASFQPTYLDVEHDVPDTIALQVPDSIRVIRSLHNFSRTPEDISQTISAMKEHAAFHYKIACATHDPRDAFRLILAAQDHPDVTVIGMGECGTFTRVCAPIFGTLLQFIALQSGSAPGQLSLQELLEVYHYQTLSPRTKVFALLGDPVSKSHSHLTHNAVFRALQIDAVYVKIPVKKEQLAEVLSYAQFLPLYGFSLTMPLKRHFSYDPINTLKRGKGHWHTRNTDGVGALDAIEREQLVRGKTMLILGAGGVSHAIAQEALQRGAFVKIANRTVEKSHALALHLGAGVEAGALIDQTFCQEYDILVNGTSVGMGDGKVPMSTQWIQPGAVVLDTVSNPQETPLLRHAKTCDCTCIGGIELFILQAVAQFVYWFPELTRETNTIERELRRVLVEQGILLQ